MKKFLLLTVAAALLTPMGARTSQAQVFDHLQCYKIKDTAKFTADVDLTALQEQFGMQNCAVKGKGSLFCVPADKVASNFVDKSKDGVPQVDLQGVTPVDDRICYKMKCPKVTIDPLTVTDQFGTRSIEKFKPALLCTPAAKGIPGAEFDIQLELETPVTLGALQLAVSYSGAPGGFVGAGGSVDCSNLTDGGNISSFFDDEGISELRTAVIGTSADIVGPDAPVATCRFTTVGHTQLPQASDFVVEVVDASDPGASPVIQVTARIGSITPVP